jgi:hypothetical protein
METNKISAFVGHYNSGKTHTILALSRALTLLDKKILYMASNSNVKYYFNFTDEELKSGNEFIRSNFTIYCTNDSNRQNVVNKVIKESSLYDFIFIEMDLNSMDYDVLNMCSRIFLIQNSDKICFERNLQLLRKLKAKNIDGGKYNIVFNQYIDGVKLDKEYMMSNYVEHVNSKAVFIDNPIITIDYDIEDFIIGLSNKVDGKLAYKKYSLEFKQALHELVNVFIEISAKEFKKIKL